MQQPPDSPATGPGAWQRLRDGGRPLTALLLVALLLKLLVMATTLEQNPLGQRLTSDARYYVERAQGLAGVWDDPLADETHHLPPLYPWLLHWVPGVAERDPSTGRPAPPAIGGVLFGQALAGVGLLVITYLLAHRRGGRVAGWIAVTLCLGYGPLTYFETKLLGDFLATVTLTGVVLLCDGLPGPRPTARALLIGGLLGAAVLLRPQALLLIPALGLWLGWRHGRAWLPFLAAAVLTIAPATLHNWEASGQLVLVSDNGGVNLWLANDGPPSGTFLTHDPAFGSIDTQAAVARQRAEAAAGRSLGPADVSRWYSAAAWDAIAADPGLFLRRVGLRTLALLESFETGVVVVPEVEQQLVPPLTAAALPFGVLLVLFVVAAAWSLGVPRREQAPLLPALCVAGMVVLTTLLFFHYSRFRLPLVPLMAVAIGSAATLRPATPVRTGGRSPGGAPALRITTALALAGLTAWLSWRPAHHHSGVLANGWTLVGEARAASAAPGDVEALERALADVERGLAADPGFVRALIAAAEMALPLGRYDDSARWLAELETVVPDEAAVVATRARLSLDPGRPQRPNPHRDLKRARAAVSQLQLLALGDARMSARAAWLGELLEQAEAAAGH